MLYRTFTIREKVLFVIFSLLLIGGAYYLFVYSPLTAQINDTRNAIYAKQDEMSLVEGRFMEMTRMKRELETLPTESELKPLMDYDNVNAVMEFLNGVLAPADTFSVSFANVDFSDKFVRRTVTVNYSCADIATGRRITDQLFDAPYRSQVKSHNISYGNENSMNATTTIVFFELNTDK